MNYVAHETSCIDEGAVIGEDTHIWHFCHVMSTAKIGCRCNIGQNVYVDSHVTIGNGCKIQNNVSVYRYVTLEDDVFCGPSMVFTNVHNPRANIKKMNQALPTLVKRGATLGANCAVVCGTTIGRYAFIGAGAVVTRDVPDHALMYGNPAKAHGWVCACGEKQDADLTCPVCGETYVLTEGGLQLRGATTQPHKLGSDIDDLPH